jgi:hypothetical protein
VKSFDNKSYYWKADINYRQHPGLYKVGKGEQGVLLCEPYKSEILPYWKFKEPNIARKSSRQIYRLFLTYLKAKDFIGADMCRKFLQMGFTRARRYANYKGGRKYIAPGETFPKGSGDPVKAQSAAIFYVLWQKAEKHTLYKEMKSAWKKKYG